MRKIEAQMVCAVRERLNADLPDWRSGNTAVRVEREGIAGTASYERNVRVYLHQNLIAEFNSSLNHARECQGLMVTDAGWQTATTKSRLNALLKCFYRGVGICQVNGDWLLNTTPFAGKDWVSYGWLDNWACQAAEAVAS